jgi:hypothetical protein
MTAPNGRLADDLIWGAKAIALELFGNDETKFVKRAFWLLTNNRIPANKIGGKWVASREKLRRHLYG